MMTFPASSSRTPDPRPPHARFRGYVERIVRYIASPWLGVGAVVEHRSLEGHASDSAGVPAALGLGWKATPPPGRGGVKREDGAAGALCSNA